MASARDLIISLGAELSDQENVAHDLWTWLPSYKVAKELRGDYACEYRPGVADVMRDAMALISTLQDALGEAAFDDVIEALAETVREEWAADLKEV
jgi:hypothetical protein